MELADVEKLMRAFENSASRELKIDDGDFHLYLSKNEARVPTVSPAAPATTAGNPAPTAEAKAAPSPEATVTAPLVGTVYLRPQPDKPAYVQVGDPVKAGDPVAVIEAMKMMTTVKSDVSGTVTAINVEDGELVEVGQPLISVKEES